MENAVEWVATMGIWDKERDATIQEAENHYKHTMRVVKVFAIIIMLMVGMILGLMVQLDLNQFHTLPKTVSRTTTGSKERIKEQHTQEHISTTTTEKEEDNDADAGY